MNRLILVVLFTSIPIVWYACTVNSEKSSFENSVDPSAGQHPISLQPGSSLPAVAGFHERVVSEIGKFRSRENDSLSVRAHLLRLKYANGNILSSNLPAVAHAERVGQLLTDCGLTDSPDDFEFANNSCRYRVAEWRNMPGEWHPGQVLSALAECGVPLTQDLVTISDRTITVSDLVEDCAQSFSFDEDIEWRSVALAVYRPHITSWTTRAGEDVSFDRITKELLRRTRTQGGLTSCWGTHAFYTLAVFLSVDGSVPIWRDRSLKADVTASLMNASDNLASTQRNDGAWDEHWSLPGMTRSVLSTEQRLLVTGHHLEWLAMAPSECRPSAVVLEAAGEFVASEVAQRSLEQRLKQICACSHGLRAFVLGMNPSTLPDEHQQRARAPPADPGQQTDMN